MHSIVKLYNGIVLRLDIAFGLDLISMLLGYLQDNKLIRMIQNNALLRHLGSYNQFQSVVMSF